jgi:hypothetical protein
MYLGMAKPVETELRLAQLFEMDGDGLGIEVFARNIEVAPAALQCIDEILQNALDEARIKQYEDDLLITSFEHSIGSSSVKLASGIKPTSGTQSPGRHWSCEWPPVPRGPAWQLGPFATDPQHSSE